jgi:hypothetical protein
MVEWNTKEYGLQKTNSGHFIDDVLAAMNLDYPSGQLG